MGSNQSTQGGKAQESTDQIIEKINNFSGNYGSHDPDGVSLQGMNRYLNQQEEKALDQKVGSSPIERKMRFDDIAGLASTIGMSDEAKFKLLTGAYNSLNTQAKYLEKAGVVDPVTAKREESRSWGLELGTPHHQSEQTVKQVKELLSNPHSYFSLSGEKLENLLQKEPGKLDEAIRADQKFVQATKGHWNLDPHRREQTAENVRNNYNGELCTGYILSLAGTSNHVPIENFMKGKEAAINAVQQGFDLYNKEALKAFGEAAMNVNNAINSGHTLVARGADTISEQTMSFSPDGHSLSNPKKR